MSRRHDAVRCVATAAVRRHWRRREQSARCRRGQIDVHGRRGGARVGGGLHARRPRLVRARLGVLPERPARCKRAARVAGGGAWPRRCRRGRRGARRRGRLLLRRPLAWVASITSVRTLDSALRQRKGNARSRNHKGAPTYRDLTRRSSCGSGGHTSQTMGSPAVHVCSCRVTSTLGPLNALQSRHGRTR